MKKFFFLIIILFSFRSWSQDILKERFYVATDKQVYLSGETVYFKAYCTDKKSGKLLDLSRIGYIEIVRERQPYVQAVIELKSGTGTGFLELPSSLVSGNYNLRMYTNWMKNFGPEFFFHRDIQIINPLSKENPRLVATAVPVLSISDTSDKPEMRVGSLFSRRSMVSVLIDMKGKEGYELYATAYLSEKKGFTGADINSTRTEYSPKTGPVETQKQGSIEVKFIPETRGHIIRATTEENLTDKDIFLSVPGSPAKLYTGISDSAGRITFLVEPKPGGEVVVPQIHSEGNHSGNIRILSPFSEEYLEEHILSEEGDPINIQKSLIGLQVAYRFGKEEEVINIAQSDTSMFYPKPDYTYFLDEYTRFPTMEEVLREYVVGVLVQKNRNGYRFETVSRDKFGIATVHAPVILIDGIPVSANTAIKLDPLKVKRLDVVTKSYYYGTTVFDGIISFQTYDGKLGELNLDPGIIPVEYPGVQQSRFPVFPQYNTDQKKSSRIPDFRTTLYWNSTIKKNNDGKYSFNFYTSDMKGKYLIVVEGINKEGKTVRLEKEILVN